MLKLMQANEIITVMVTTGNDDNKKKETKKNIIRGDKEKQL